MRRLAGPDFGPSEIGRDDFSERRRAGSQTESCAMIAFTRPGRPADTAADLLPARTFGVDDGT